LYPETTVTLETLYHYNGYDISCEGGSDGGLIASAIGSSPFTYRWSTGSQDHQITGLSAGNYAITITDGNGCIESAEVTLIEPDKLITALEITEPGCFDQSLGSITVIPEGGVSPYAFSIDGFTFQDEPMFNNLSKGVYQLTIRDANGCEHSEIVSIDVPLSIQVELGSDQVISLGESANLTAIVNLPFDSIAAIQWTGIDSIACPKCLTHVVAPVITTAYSISVSAVDGCADSDTMTVHVSTDHHFYIPNIFSPNGDGINDVLSISASDGVERILSFSIFDRWGNLVFEKNNSQPNEVNWDGAFNDKTLNPGVFTFKAVIRYSDNRTEIRYGDVTLLR
jgi:gliding motility-associated-like protein